MRVFDRVYQWFIDLLKEWGWTCWAFKDCVGNPQRSELYAMLRKCEFLFRYIAFLFHIVSDKGIQIDPKKIDAVKN